MSDPLLSLSGVSRHFGALRAVDDVSISVPAGARHALIGPNGAGKSTLFKLVTGSMPVTSGTVTLAGSDITRLSEHQRARRGISQTLQHSSLFLSQTVERNVREQDDDARPRIANPLASIEEYDTVLLGSPIWNVRAPMIMTTFVESYDFTGRTVHPVVTYAVSGLGRTERDYAASCPGARMGLGLAVRGEEVASSGPAVERWRDQLRG